MKLKVSRKKKVWKQNVHISKKDQKEATQTLLNKIKSNEINNVKLNFWQNKYIFLV